MKNKILNVLLILLAVMCLTGCGEKKEESNRQERNNQETNKISDIEEKKKDDNIDNISSFLTYINNKEYDKAVELIDADKINELMKINLPTEEFSKALNRSFNSENSVIQYDVKSLRNVSKEDLLDEMSKMDENELLKNRKDLIDLFDGYDLYMVEVEQTYNDEKMNIHDVVFVNDSTICGTIFINGLFSYYYGAVYNRPGK